MIHKFSERTLKRVLLSFLSDLRAISTHQHSCLLRRFYLSNLLVFLEVVTHMIDKDHAVDVIFFDFTKALSTENHWYLLVKMKPLGLGDVVVQFDRSKHNWAGLESTRRWRATRGHYNVQYGPTTLTRSYP